MDLENNLVDFREVTAKSTSSYAGPFNIDPSSFNASITSLLLFLGGEQYVDIFKSRNISQETLMELTDDDLSKLGVDDPNVRAGIIEEVKNFPLYEQILRRKKIISDLELADIASSLRDTNQHIHRIYLNMISTNSAIRMAKDLQEDVLADKPVSVITKHTLDELVTTLNKMDNALQTKFKCLKRNYAADSKKIIVGIIGTATIAVLSVLFMRSLSYAK